MNSRIPLHATMLAASLLGCASAAAQTRAVERTHVEFGFTSTESDTSDSTSSGALGASLTGTFPLGRYFGAALAVNYSDSNIRTRDVLGEIPDAQSGSRPSCGFDSMGGEASVFFRIPSYGRIRASYGKGELSGDCGNNAVFPVTGTDSMDTENYRADAEYYLGNFTFGAAYTTTTLEDNDEDLKSTTLAASWYPIDSLKITASGNDLYDEDTYGLVLEHQPQMLGDGFSVRLGYWQTSDSPKSKTFQLGLSYFFGRQVPLKDRDRQYR